MGFNFAGLVIGDAFDKKIEKLGENLEWGIELIGEKAFGEVYTTEYPDNEFDLYFTDKATFIFYDHDWYYEKFYSQTADSLSYYYLSRGMLFMMDLTRDNEIRRTVQELERERKYEKGRQLSLEKRCEGVDEIIYEAIADLTEIDLRSIDYDAVAFRCRKVEYTGPKTRMTENDKRLKLWEERMERNFDPNHDGMFRF